MAAQNFWDAKKIGAEEGSLAAEEVFSAKAWPVKTTPYATSPIDRIFFIGGFVNDGLEGWDYYLRSSFFTGLTA